MRRILFILLLFVSTASMAQDLRERGEVRKGNRAYLKEDYATAAEHYSQAIVESPENFEARYNLGSAMVKSEQMEQAEQLLATVAADSLLVDGDRSQAYYNLGNSQFQQQKLEEALESYKNAMRFDPDDMEAKYNYAYTKALLEQNQDQNQDQDQDQNEDNQDQGDQNEDQQDQDQNQDQGDQNEDQQDQDQNQDQQDQDQDQNGDQDEQEQPQQPEPREGEISEQEQQQMLDAIQAQEDKTQEDLKEKARGVVVQGAKNW